MHEVNYVLGMSAIISRPTVLFDRKVGYMMLSATY